MAQPIPRRPNTAEGLSTTVSHGADSDKGEQTKVKRKRRTRRRGKKATTSDTLTTQAGPNLLQMFEGISLSTDRDEIGSGGVSVEGPQSASHGNHTEHRAPSDIVSPTGLTDQPIQTRACLPRQRGAYYDDNSQRLAYLGSMNRQYPACSLPAAISAPPTQGSAFQPQLRTGVHRNVIQPFTQQSRQRGAWARPRRRSSNPRPDEPRSDEPPPRERLEHTLRIPSPTTAYLEQARAGMVARPKAQQLLVILDLNGTLLCRQARSRVAFKRRPGVDKFLDYLFAHHKVMVWSSARPENVEAICMQLLSNEHLGKLVAIWARDTLRLTPEQYSRRTQVYKQLSWVWQNRRLPQFSQANTVLIDDSWEKARSEPYNLLQIDEFVASPDQMETDVLGQVVEYLEWAKMYADVSTCMHAHPWVFDPKHTAVWPRQ